MSFPIHADNANFDTSEVGRKIVKGVYQPRFENFKQTTAQFLDVAQHSCLYRSTKSFDELRDQFGLLVIAFSGIELYRVGPLLQENRQNRLFFWPDKRRTGERQLRTLLKQTAEGELTTTMLSDKSVALQGLPATERLLFGKNALVHLAAESSAPDCAVVITIAQNINSIAKALSVGWDTESEFVQSMVYPKSSSEYFRTEDEVLRSIVTQIIVGIEVVLDRKLAPLTGENARWKKAPLWLSEQTIPMIKSNLGSLQSLLVGSSLASASGLVNELTFEFRTANNILEALLELPSMTDDSGRLTNAAHSLVRSLVAVVGGIAITLNERFVQTLGISPGFNSEDGD